MVRLLYIVAAAALLSACATLRTTAVDFSLNASIADGPPVEPPVFDRTIDDAFRALDRRSFSPPLRRQRDLRVIVVITTDRLRRRIMRRRRRS